MCAGQAGPRLGVRRSAGALYAWGGPRERRGPSGPGEGASRPGGGDGPLRTSERLHAGFSGRPLPTLPPLNSSPGQVRGRSAQPAR